MQHYQNEYATLYIWGNKYDLEIRIFPQVI